MADQGPQSLLLMVSKPMNLHLGSRTGPSTSSSCVKSSTRGNPRIILKHISAQLDPELVLPTDTPSPCVQMCRDFLDTRFCQGQGQRWEPEVRSAAFLQSFSMFAGCFTLEVAIFFSMIFVRMSPIQTKTKQTFVLTIQPHQTLKPEMQTVQSFYRVVRFRRCL